MITQNRKQIAQRQSEQCEAGRKKKQKIIIQIYRLNNTINGLLSEGKRDFYRPKLERFTIPALPSDSPRDHRRQTELRFPVYRELQPDSRLLVSVSRLLPVVERDQASTRLAYPNLRLRLRVFLTDSLARTERY